MHRHCMYAVDICHDWLIDLAVGAFISDHLQQWTGKE